MTMTTVGYGDVTPTTTYEKGLAIAAMIIGGMIFAYTIKSLGKIVTEYNSLSAQYIEKMIFVN
jgi:hypothetical protein